MFLPNRTHYFSHQLNREVIELYWSTGLSNLAVNLSYIFEPIFLYQQGYTASQIMFFFVTVYTAYALLIFPAAKISSRIGYKHSILISSIIYILYWFVFYQIKFHPVLLLPAAVVFALEKSFFWPSYNADIAINSVKGQRAREIGFLASLTLLAGIAGPVAGGFLSYQFGFPVLFSVSAILMLASVYPLFRSPEIYTRHRFHFKNFWHILRRYSRNFFAYWGYAEDLMVQSLWPLYMFLIVPQLFSIGLITTFASLIAIVVMLYLGKLLDGSKKLRLLELGSVFYGMTWVLRFLAASLPAIVGFDAVTRIGKALVSVPLVSKTFDLAGTDGPDHAIAYMVFYEFSLSIGKIFTALGAIWIISITGNIAHVFVFAGALTMFYSLLKK